MLIFKNRIETRNGKAYPDINKILFIFPKGTFKFDVAHETLKSDIYYACPLD